MITSNDFAANSITKSLYNKLLGGGYTFPRSNLTIWVSSSGNNDIADGTEQKPFATFDKALNYIQEHTALCSRPLRIAFANDYTQEYTGINHINLPFNEYGYYLEIYGNNYNVVLSAFQVHCNSCVTFNGITISSEANYPVAVQGRLLIGENVSVISKSGRALLVSNGGIFIFKLNASLHFTNLSDNVSDVFQVVNGAFVTHENSGATTMSITLDGNIRYIFNANGCSKFLRFDKCTITQNTGTTQNKYIIVKNSYFEMSGRGTDWIPGEEGTVDDTSIIQ